MSYGAFAGDPQVAVTSKPVHSLVASVMAGIATPHLVVDGAASPHTFTLKPSGARAIHQADVFIRVSEQLEPFTKKLMASLPARVKTLSLTEAPGITVLAQRAGDTFETHSHGGEKHDHDHHDHGEHNDAPSGAAIDSHIWLEPRNAQAIARHTAKLLGEIYPEHAAKFAANADALSAAIDEMAGRIDSSLADVKGKPFIVFHDATQYFERRFGLAAAGSVTVSPDVQPSAKRLTAVRKKIAALGATCVFAEPSFQPKLISAVTEGTSAKAGTLDPEGVSLAPGPALYQKLMENLAAGIKSCLAPPS